jgi:DNA-directed RNA polymerase specialized sigma24 family protein
MIRADMRCAYRELEARLRPFVARRVSAASEVDDVMQDVFLRMQRMPARPARGGACRRHDGRLALRNEVARSAGAREAARAARGLLRDRVGRARPRHRLRAATERQAASGLLLRRPRARSLGPVEREVFAGLSQRVRFLIIVDEKI